MSTVEAPRQQHILLHNISWQAYENLLKEFDGRPIRLTYDHGELEIMTLSHEHESYGKLFGRFIEMLTFVLNVAIHSGGSTTFRKDAKKRGLEPDECYWIQNEPLMRGRKVFDIAIDPPPDLVVEIDITSSSLNRMAIYATMLVPEIWRFSGESVQVYRLGSDGKYHRCERSPTFTSLPMEKITWFLRQSDSLDETTLLRSLADWVREHLLPTWKGVGENKPLPHRRPKRK